MDTKKNKAEKEKINIKFREVREYHLPEVLQLLKQLDGGELEGDHLKAWQRFKGNPSSNAVIGIMDDRVVAYGSLVIENKINGKIAGHIEDVVVDEEFRNYNIGTKLVEELLYIAEMEDCFKVSLFCKKELEHFYNKNGFEVNNIVMKKWLN